MDPHFKDQVRKVLKIVQKSGCQVEGCTKNSRALLENCKLCGAGPFCRAHVRTHWRQNHKLKKEKR